jgi:hypothetical protein
MATNLKLAIPKILANTCAEAAIIPGNPKPTNVEIINQYTAGLHIL